MYSYTIQKIMQGIWMELKLITVTKKFFLQRISTPEMI